MLLIKFTMMCEVCKRISTYLDRPDRLTDVATQPEMANGWSVAPLDEKDIFFCPNHSVEHLEDDD